MKSSFFYRVMILATAVLLATGAYAANAGHKGRLEISSAVQVNGTQLGPGDYTVTWQGDGPEVALHITQGKKEVATTQARIVALDKKAQRDSADISMASGSAQLTGISFEGQKVQLEVVGAGSAGGSVK